MAEVIVPAVTIFDKDGKPDLKGNEKVIDFLIDNGVDGILVMGSNGEFPNISNEMRLNYLNFYQQYVDSRVKLIAGTGCMNYADTVAMTKAVSQMNFDAVLVIEPYYFAMSQEEIFLYYDRLANDVLNKILIYNFPARSGVSIDLNTIKRLSEEHPNIVGMKDSIVTPTHTSMILHAVDTTKFKVYSGFDDQFLLNISNGGQGCIGALANIVPDIWSKLILSANKHDFNNTFYLAGLINRLSQLYSWVANPAVLIKQLMIHRGLSIQSTGIFPFELVDQKTLQRSEDLLDEILREFHQITFNA